MAWVTLNGENGWKISTNGKLNITKAPEEIFGAFFVFWSRKALIILNFTNIKNILRILPHF